MTAPTPHHQVQPVLLCGGSGTRLWPLSRAGFPKQFLSLFGHESLFQAAVSRVVDSLGSVFSVNSPLIVAGEEHRFLVLEQLREVFAGTPNILLEPKGRGTAASLTIAALASDSDLVLVVTPSDQVILNEKAYTSALARAVAVASLGHICLLGVQPETPHTGFGYIKATRDLSCLEESWSITRFVEKPEFLKAQAYLVEGGYFWNSGIFVLKASTWIEILQELRPDIFGVCQRAWDQRSSDTLFTRPNADLFSTVPMASIDVAVMENYIPSRIELRMIPLDAGWRDVGTWDSLRSSLPQDDHGNAFLGDVFSQGARDTISYSSGRMIALLGVEGLIVAETPDAVLVADRRRGEDLKLLVENLLASHRAEAFMHLKVHRPWGWFETIAEGPAYKLKRLFLRQGAAISLQKHRHRSEHWVVVSGSAEVICDEEIFLLGRDQSTYIPMGAVHRLTNVGETELEIIEVQTGTELNEDDIERLDDRYGRP